MRRTAIRLQQALLHAEPARIGQLLDLAAKQQRQARRMRPSLVGRLLPAAGLLALSGPLAAQRFAPPAMHPFGLSPADEYAAPEFADLDADGDHDLVVGDVYGHFRFFRNTGTAQAPAFAASLQNPFRLASVGFFATPAFADLDADGDLDLIAGERFGNIRYFENTGTAASPAFAASLQNPFGLLDFGYQAHPALADLDGDGDLDLLVGNNNATLFFLENTGTAQAPAFAAPVFNPFGLTDVGSYAAPIFKDLDADGDWDLIVGERFGHAIYFQNTGTAQAPAFARNVQDPFGLADSGDFASPALADLDGDGDLSYLAGNQGGQLAYADNIAPVPARCGSAGLDARFDWIRRVRILEGGFDGAPLLDHRSLSDQGYGDYTQLPDWPSLEQGGIYTLAIHRGMDPGTENRLQAYRVWIDFNRNGRFSDPGEQVYARYLTDQPIVRGELFIPADAALGAVLMRVQLKHAQVPFSPCETFAQGETEDYVVNIAASSSASRWAGAVQDGEALPEAGALRAYPNPARGSVQVQGVSDDAWVEVWRHDGQLARRTQGPRLDLSGLAPGLYLLSSTAADGHRQVAKLQVE
jgi:hypothetical protein